MEFEIEIYETESGKCPFEMWFENIRNGMTRAKISMRLDRLKLGNFGDCRVIGDGISELRMHYGSGIRIYYSRIGRTIILLLWGGDKGSQTRDINKAKEYLKDYHLREKKIWQEVESTKIG